MLLFLKYKILATYYLTLLNINDINKINITDIIKLLMAGKK